VKKGWSTASTSEVHAPLAPTGTAVDVGAVDAGAAGVGAEELGPGRAEVVGAGWPPRVGEGGAPASADPALPAVSAADPHPAATPPVSGAAEVGAVLAAGGTPAGPAGEGAAAAPVTSVPRPEAQPTTSTTAPATSAAARL
jgi:hypothetical protein